MRLPVILFSVLSHNQQSMQGGALSHVYSELTVPFHFIKAQDILAHQKFVKAIFLM